MSEKEALNMDAGSPPPSYQQTYPPQGPPPGQYPPPQGQYQPVPQGPPMQYPPQQGYGQPQMQQVVVTQPGQAPVVVAQPRPPDYMVLSILACLCCFWPTGICAIYYACRTNTLAGEGNMMEAQRTSNSARTLVIISVVVGIICIALLLILRFVVYTTSAASAYHYK